MKTSVLPRLGYARVTGRDRAEAHAEIITNINKVLDGFLLCAILVIATLGIYELFVDDITDRHDGRAPQLLKVHDSTTSRNASHAWCC